MFQLLHQVVGRAGHQASRASGSSRRTSPIIRSCALIASDHDAFSAAEIEVREKTSYPLFGRLASLLISGPEKPAAEGFARRIAALAPRNESLRALVPAEASPWCAVAIGCGYW